MKNDGVEVRVDTYGNKSWWLNGKLHRTDGPAIEYANGSKQWYLNGERHRTDGPAYEGADGDKAWFLNGGLHRTDGPAYEGADGTKHWYLNDKEVDQLVFWVTTKERELAHEQ